MPSNSPFRNFENKDENSVAAGTLYIVATPIGNMDDITLRAIKTLKAADIAAAEDTRHTAALLAHHDIHTPLVSCHEHNECRRSSQLIEKLKSGMSVALVTDAGTPSVSDPGYRVVKTAIEHDIRVVPVPGASAAVAALSVSGLPTDAFVFMGFPPKKRMRRTEQLQALADEKKTIIFYESPRRIVALLEEMLLIMGDRYVVLSREMTKYHEEFVRGAISRVIQSLKQRPVVKGECTLIISGYEKKEGVMSDAVISEIRDRLKRRETPPSQLAKEIAQKYGLPRKKVYDTILVYQADSAQYDGGDTKVSGNPEDTE